MFTCNIQYGGDPHDKHHDKGQTDYNHFISVLQNFPWLQEMEKANTHADGSSPTVSAVSKQDRQSLWVSIAGDSNAHDFLLAYTYPRTKKGLFGLGKERTVDEVDIYVIESIDQANGYFRLFFDRNYELLQADLKKLQKF